MEHFYYLLSMVFTRIMCEIRSYLNRGIFDQEESQRYSRLEVYLVVT